MGRPPSCLCGECRKCRVRDKSRAAYQALSLDERRAIIAKRDPEKVRAADRARYYRHRESRLARMRELAKENLEARKGYNKAWAERNPEKRAAHSKLWSALRSGRVTRQPCQECGEPKAHAHHFDYSKPLDVIWLCSLHHGEVHRRYPSTLRTEEAA